MIKARAISLAILAIIFFVSTLEAEDKVIENALSKCQVGKSNFANADKYTFKYADRDAIIVVPKAPRKDRAWILRPAFFGAFANADEELVKRGFFLLYYDVTHCYASPNAMNLLDNFYKFAIAEFKLNDKVALEGLSRGGACALNWANRNPSKIACVYVDAPVCDFSVWPSEKQTNLYKDFLKEWNVESFEGFKGNPLDNLENLAHSGVPVLMVAGDADKTVPFSQNGQIYAKRFFDNGGNIETIIKKGCDHHPHGLENPDLIVNFIEQNCHAKSSKNQEITNADSSDKFRKIFVNSSMANSATKFTEQKRGKVAFVGGSITEMKGWKELVKEDLKRRFPQTKFEFTDAGISSLGTTPHAFRLSSDVPDLKDIDMLFIEGAVNDDTNRFTEEAQIRAMEGILRHCLSANPNMDIIMLAFIWDGFLAKNESGETPEVIVNHQRAADYYKVNFIDLNAEISERIRHNQFDWRKFGGTHPSPFGHEIYAKTISKLFDKTLHPNKIIAHKMPEIKLDKYSYCTGILTPVDATKIRRGWTIENNWKAKTKANVRSRFSNLKILESRSPNSALELDFKGTAIGIYCLSGDEAGILEYSIDGGETKYLDTYTKWSDSLYLPWLFILEDTLPNAPHTLKLKISEKKNDASKGHACQIISFAQNPQ